MFGSLETNEKPTLKEAEHIEEVTWDVFKNKTSHDIWNLIDWLLQFDSTDLFETQGIYQKPKQILNEDLI